MGPVTLSGVSGASTQRRWRHPHPYNLRRTAGRDLGPIRRVPAPS
ncbi:hypothetical protein STANM309S_05474 [Streptomyces tanashiensis]